MRAKFLLLQIIVLLFANTTFGQFIPPFSQFNLTKKTVKTYRIAEDEIKDKIYSFDNPNSDSQVLMDNGRLYDKRSPLSRYIENLNQTRKTRNKYNVLYSGRSLNLLFSKKLETVFSNSNDLSLQKSFFNIDASDKSFSFGYNIDFREGDPLKQLDLILSIGVKIISSDGFAAISNGGDLLEDNIGVNLKLSWIGNGTIGWKTIEQGKHIKKNREFLYHKYNEKVNNFNTKVLPKLKAHDLAIYPDDANEKINAKIAAESDKLFYEMLEEEIKYIEDNELYTRIWNHWFTLEGYIPVGDKIYSTTPISNNNKAQRALYYPFNVNLSWNFYVQESNKFSWFGKLISRVKGNSNIDVEGLKPEEFQSINTVNGVSTLTDPVKAINIDAYERFVTTSLRAEVAFFYKNTIGFSPSIEKNFGTYDGLNWKFGIPFSLKDKEGKPTVNFEIQWKKTETLTGSEKLFGFSTSFFFGDLIKKKS